MSRPFTCQTAHRTTDSRPTPIADLPARRVWLLERRDQSHASRFAGAVLVLADEGVYVLIVVSHDPRYASEQALHDNRLRIQLERDAANWPTLDAALAHADHIKRTWIDREWIEVKEEFA